MEETEKKDGRGRPWVRTNIDREVFEQLCGIQCTQQEIADFFGMSVDSVLRWCKDTYNMTFEEAFSQFRSKGRVSLRRTQWRMSEKNPALAIWLGKQYLGQKDEQNINQNFSPIVIKDDLSDEPSAPTVKDDLNGEE